MIAGHKRNPAALAERGASNRDPQAVQIERKYSSDPDELQFSPCSTLRTGMFTAPRRPVRVR
jgi:hypothetical protein